MLFSVSEFAGFKNIYMSMYKKKLHKIAIVLLSGRGGGVKALAECPANNKFIFDVLPNLP